MEALFSLQPIHTQLNIFKLLSQKPWEADQSLIDNQHDGKTLVSSKAKLGVKTIMIVSTVIFSLFVVFPLFFSKC